MRQFTYHEWIEWRSYGLGGSDAPIIKRASPFATPLELFLRRTKRIPPQPVTYPMLRGIRLEPEARREYEKLTGIPMPARCLESEHWPVARGSFDGLNDEARIPLEIKCPGKADHLSALNGDIPAKYIWQLVHLLHVCRYDRIHYFSYNPSFPGPKSALIVFRRHHDLERMLIEEEKRFWKFIVKDNPPPPGARELPWPWPKYDFNWRTNEK